MESAMLAGVLLHPAAVLVSLTVVIVATVVSYYAIPGARGISPGRLLGGYLGAIAVVALVTAADSYVSPEESQAVWKVPPEHYWRAMWRQFLPSFVILGYASVLGIAVVGAPAIFVLNWKGRATVPWILLLAATLSVLGALALESFIGSRRPLETVAYLVGGHLLLALGFSLGARIPWRTQ